MARSVRGRKKEVTLKVDSKGNITVARNYSAMDIVMVTSDGGFKTLTPRETVVLEQKKGGLVVVKETPPDTKVVVVKEDGDGKADSVRPDSPGN